MKQFVAYHISWDPKCSRGGICLIATFALVRLTGCVRPCCHNRCQGHQNTLGANTQQRTAMYSSYVCLAGIYLTRNWIASMSTFKTSACTAFLKGF